MSLREFLGLSFEYTNGELQYNSKEIYIKDIIIYETKELIPFTSKLDNAVKEIYRIYKEIYKIEDKESWSEGEFSIIIVQNGMLGREYNKVKGYYRNKAENGINYPEVFQVVEGYVEFLLQQPGDSHTKIKDAAMVRLQRSEILVIPPSFGLTIINPSEKPAIISRLRASETQEIYDNFKETKGECYLRVEGGKWDYNDRYEEIPILRLVESQLKWKTIKRGIPIYNSYVYNPNLLRTLIEPNPLEFVL